MEGGQMTIVIPDISPVEILARWRGFVEDVHPAYPETIHVEVRDATGGLWKFATHDSYYSPSKPDQLRGKTVVEAALDGRMGDLTVGFSDGTSFRVWMDPPDVPHDPVNWRLYTPEGLILAWGPGDTWALKRGSDPI
jgi:hypothetical protein